MRYYVKNISNNYAMLLKHQLKAGDVLDLEILFKEFTKEIKTPRGQIIKPQFKEEEFDKFLDWVTEQANDRSKWELVVDEVLVAKPKNTELHLPSTVEAEALKQRELDPKNLTPQQIAWLPLDEKTRKFISTLNDTKKLKRSLNFVKNLHGQEKLRLLIENRIADLAESR